MRRFAYVIAANALLCACQNGTVTLSVADAPIDGADQVQIKFTGVDLVEADGSKHTFDLDPDKTVDLLASTSTQLLTNITVPAGDYQQITLHIAADGTSVNSRVIYPSTSTSSRTGPQSLELDEARRENGVAIPATFSVTRLRNTALTADFDLRKSILEPGDADLPLTFDPKVRVVNNDDVGTLMGTVAANLVTQGARCNPGAIYVYEGSNVLQPGDAGGKGTQPFASTTLPSSGSATGSVSYTVGYLPPQSYTIALICNPEIDDPADDESASLDVAQKVTEVVITAGDTAHANFE